MNIVRINLTQRHKDSKAQRSFVINNPLFEPSSLCVFVFNLFFSFFFSLSLFGEVVFQKTEGPFSLQVSVSSQNIKLNDEFTLELALQHPKDQMPALDKLHVIRAKANGIFPFYLKNKQVEELSTGTKWTYTLEPQLYGKQELDLGALQFSIPKIPMNITEGALKDLPPLKPAPLMPLLKGDPLELNLKLRERLYHEDQSARNVAIFKSYTIPWLYILPLLLLLLSAPYLLYFWQQQRRRQIVHSAPSFFSIMQRMQALQKSELAPKELAFEVAKLFKMGFENGPSMTYQELIQSLQNSNRFSVEQLAAFKQQFDVLERLQYTRETPTRAQVMHALESTETLLH